jgi:hypothetical protein
MMIFWISAAMTGILTIFAWRTAENMKGDPQSAGMRKAYLIAAACGAVGTLCFIAAALI